MAPMVAEANTETGIRMTAVNEQSEGGAAERTSEKTDGVLDAITKPKKGTGRFKIGDQTGLAPGQNLGRERWEGGVPDRGSLMMESWTPSPRN
jgi:hypothetical protein